MILEQAIIGAFVGLFMGVLYGIYRLIVIGAAKVREAAPALKSTGEKMAGSAAQAVINSTKKVNLIES